MHPIRTVALAAFALAAALGGAAAAEQTPEQFLRGIYNLYMGDPEKAPGISIEDDASVRRWFAPDLAAMIIADTKRAATQEDVPELDFDPFTNSQETRLTGAVGVKVTTQTADRATASATFTNSGRKETLTYTLVKVAGQWKIYDINWDGQQTLRSLFQHH